jgi:acetyltransferase-like isoleucine patch superfamily enzyme
VIRQQISVGENAVIGAGAAVVENLAGQATYVGVPARPI